MRARKGAIHILPLSAFRIAPSEMLSASVCAPRHPGGRPGGLGDRPKGRLLKKPIFWLLLIHLKPKHCARFASSFNLEIRFETNTLSQKWLGINDSAPIALGASRGLDQLFHGRTGSLAFQGCSANPPPVLREPRIENGFWDAPPPGHPPPFSLAKEADSGRILETGTAGAARDQP